MESEKDEDVNVCDNDHSATDGETLSPRTQKVNSFSIDSLLSDNNKSRADNNRGVQSSDVFNSEKATVSDFNARLHCGVDGVGAISKCSVEELDTFRDSQSCPSASYSRSFSDGK